MGRVTMSYYYSLTPSQIIERKQAYEELYVFDDGYNYVIERLVDIQPRLNLVSDYIGYLIYCSNRMMRKYKDKEVNVLDYLAIYRKADYYLSFFIKLFGMESIKTINPLAYRMMNRFLTTESL